MSEAFDLQSFLPFRLVRLAHEVSQRLADTYSERFGIDVARWRVLATLSTGERCTAQSVVASTRTHKSTISRAVNCLIEGGWVERVVSDHDGREKLLRLTSTGRQRFAEMAPVVLAFERELCAGLDQTTRRQFTQSISALEAALELGQHRSGIE